MTALWLFAAAAHATQRHDETIAIDAARSNAQFRVKAIWMVGVKGEFASVRGHVEINRADAQAIVDARIDAATVRMNHRGFEDWVKSAEFFDVAAHPEIHFVSEPFPLWGLREGGALPGVLTMRGVSAPVAFDLDAATCPRPGYACAITASGTIARSVFGMRSRLGMLGDRVRLSFNVYLGPVSPAPLQ